MRGTRSFGVILGIGILALGCSKSSGRGEQSPGSGDPEFDKKWAALAQSGLEVAYIEDDRGEGLMGNVRRASRVKADPPALVPGPSGAVDILPEQPSGDEVQRIIRGNLIAVRGCYMTMARSGQAPTGKAIVSFMIGADGKPATVRVDAPNFRDTPLSNCMTAQIERWAFPKSQKGGGVVSYPFVFVGG